MNHIQNANISIAKHYFFTQVIKFIYWILKILGLFSFVLYLYQSKPRLIFSANLHLMLILSCIEKCFTNHSHSLNPYKLPVFFYPFLKVYFIDQIMSPSPGVFSAILKKVLTEAIRFIHRSAPAPVI